MSGALTPPGAGWPLVGEDIRLGALETGPFGPLHRGLLLDMISFMCLSSYLVSSVMRLRSLIVTSPISCSLDRWFNRVD